MQFTDGQTDKQTTMQTVPPPSCGGGCNVGVLSYLYVDMHAAYLGRTSYYSNWPSTTADHSASMFDRCATVDQPTPTSMDCPLPQITANTSGQTIYGRAGTGFHVGTSLEFHPPGPPQMSNGVETDVKAIASSDESFCSSDDPPPSKNSTSGSVVEFVSPLPLPSYHSRYPAPVVDSGGQSFSPLPFADYPFPVLPPTSTACLIPQPPGYVGLGATSRGRLQRQNGVKPSTKLTPSSRTRSNTGSYDY